MTEFEQFIFTEGPKKAILQSALGQLARQGLLDFTLSEVSRGAGISRQNMRYHYKTTNEILMDLIGLWAQSGQKVTTDVLTNSLGMPPMDLILKIVEASFLWVERFPHFAKLTPVINQLAISNKTVSDLQKKVTDTGLKRIENLIDKAGVQPDKISVLAQGVHLTLIGGVLYSLSTQEADNSFVEKVTKESIGLLLRTAI